MTNALPDRIMQWWGALTPDQQKRIEDAWDDTSKTFKYDPFGQFTGLKYDPFPSSAAQLGYDKPPDRYVDESGRETIDKIRDSMSDEAFIAHCWAQVIRYRDRTGKKDDPEIEEGKARFYVQMARHVTDSLIEHPEGYASPFKDPRHYRPTFATYVRQPWPGTFGTPKRDEDEERENLIVQSVVLSEKLGALVMRVQAESRGDFGALAAKVSMMPKPDTNTLPLADLRGVIAFGRRMIDALASVFREED